MNLIFKFRVAILCCVLSGVACAQESLPAGTHSADDTTQDPAALTLSQAEDALSHGNYEQAVTLLSHALQQKPGNALALYDLGFAYDSLDRTADAESTWRHAIEFDPKQFESRLALGLLLARTGQADAAREQLRACLLLTPANGGDAAKAPAYRALARLDAKRDSPTASEELQSALKLSPETASDTLLAAELAENVGELDAAEAAYRRLLARDPQSADATAGLVHLLIREKKYPDAETLLKAGLAAHPKDPSLTAQLASVYGAENRVDEAVPLLEDLHAEQPTDRNIERMLAEIYTQSGDAVKADPLFVDLLANISNDASLLDERGDNLIRQRRYAEAVAVLHKALAINPSSGESWSSLAFAASENHDPQTSLDALAQRAKYLPDVPATLFLYAVSYDALHQYKVAAGYYKKFLAAANGKFPDQEWQAQHRLVALNNMMK